MKQVIKLFVSWTIVQLMLECTFKLLRNIKYKDEFKHLLDKGKHFGHLTPQIAPANNKKWKYCRQKPLFLMWDGSQHQNGGITKQSKCGHLFLMQLLYREQAHAKECSLNAIMRQDKLWQLLKVKVPWTCSEILGDILHHVHMDKVYHGHSKSAVG